MHSRQFVVVGLLSLGCNSVLDIGDYKLRLNSGGTSGVGGSIAGGATSNISSTDTGVAAMGLGGTESTPGGGPSAGRTSNGGDVATGGINTGSETGGAAAGTTSGGATATGGSGLGDTQPTSGGATVASDVVTGGNPANGGSMPTGGSDNAGGATSPGGSNATGSRPATGGNAPAGGAFATGGDVSASTASATGGDASTGGVPATGGNAPTGGTSALITTIAIVPECAGKAPGDRVCNGQFVEVCGANLASVQTVDMCLNQACVNGACQGNCVPKKMRCNGTIPQTCTDAGQWEGYTACEGATPVCNAGSCGTCPSNSGSEMVLLPLGYCIDSTEVTQAQYKDWLDKAPAPTAENQIAECSLNKKFTPDCSASSPTSPTLWPPTLSMLDHPVVCVDWCDAYAYCAGMGKRLCGNIHGGSLGINDYQDASISQWYAACTSGGIFPPTSFPYGSPYQPDYCNDGTQAAVAVGSKPKCQSTIPGYTGVYDLSGNVAEWEDACSGPETSATCRIRGGAYWHTEELDDGLACGSPDGYNRIDAYDSLGFRCCYP